MDAVTNTTSSERGASAARPPTPAMTKEQWIQRYTARILRTWLHRQAPLGLAWTYANWIRRDLAQAYAQPLKKAFIEKTYVGANNHSP